MDNFYDRTQNTTGVDSSNYEIVPQYGSSATFKVKNDSLFFGDRIPSFSHNGLNYLDANFSFNLSLRKKEAQKLVSYFESQVGTGIIGVSDSSNFYRTLSGTIDSLNSLETSNGEMYQAALSFSVERNAPSFSWSGMSFVNSSTRQWNTGIFFSKDDICWLKHDTENPHSNWYYCAEDHFSSLDNNPLSQAAYWTQELPLNPNNGFSVSQKPFVKKSELRGSFVERVNDQKNVHAFDSISVSWSNISDKKAKAILHFAESHGGTQRFSYEIPEIYNRPKVFVCPEWTHQFISKDSNNVSLTLIEDPLGIIQEGKPTFLITQSSGQPSLSLGVTGENVFYRTGNSSKALLTGESLVINWSDSSKQNAVKIYGNVQGITGAGQYLTNVIPWNAGELESVNFSQNNLKNINFHLCPKLKSINVSGNSIDGFDFHGLKNLESAAINNNSGSFLAIDDCDKLVSISGFSNAFHESYVTDAFQKLDSNGFYSGAANFSGLTALSGSYVSSLLNKEWAINANFSNPVTTTTTTTTTTTPSPDPSYILSVGYSTNNYDACHGSISVDISGNAPSLASSTRVICPEEILSGVTNIYFSDGANVYNFFKICCDKAIFASAGICPVPTTTIYVPPTTTIPPTTTTTTTDELSSTTVDMCVWGCTDPNALNFDPLAICDDGSCIFP